MFSLIREIVVQILDQKIKLGFGDVEQNELVEESANVFIDCMTALLERGGLGELKNIFCGLVEINKNKLFDDVCIEFIGIFIQHGLTLIQANDLGQKTSYAIIELLRDKFLSNGIENRDFKINNIIRLINGCAAGLEKHLEPLVESNS